MGTLEAVSTIMALWPKCFQPAEKWRQMLVDEFENWEHEQIGRAVDRVKSTHSSRRVSIETFRAARGSVVTHRQAIGIRSLPETESQATQSYGYLAQQWLVDNDLWDQFKRAPGSDQTMIRRLVAVLMLTAGWQSILEQQAGDPTKFAPWLRIENLIRAAEKATIETNAGPIKACYPTKRTHTWEPPSVYREVTLPEPPIFVSEEENRVGVGRILEIAKKYGGLKVGNFGTIYNSPEYQAYLVDYTERTGRQPA